MSYDENEAMDNIRKLNADINPGPEYIMVGKMCGRISTPVIDSLLGVKKDDEPMFRSMLSGVLIAIVFCTSPGDFDTMYDIVRRLKKDLAELELRFNKMEERK